MSGLRRSAGFRFTPPLSMRLIYRNFWYGNRLGAWRMNLALRKHITPSEFADDRVENRGEEDAEERDAEHAEEDGGAERLAHFGAGAGGGDEGEDAEDEGEARHQDGTEAQ